jgi:hypothetical protein
MRAQELEENIDLTTTNGTAELEARVYDRLSGQLCDFQLEVVEEGLILRGHAHTYHAKQLAQHVVMEATQLPILANQIEVS